MITYRRTSLFQAIPVLDVIVSVQELLSLLVFLFPYERERLAHNTVGQVHARLTEPLYDR
jgi:hypothetical protein